MQPDRDRPNAAVPASDQNRDLRDEVQRLQDELDQLRRYTHALEQRCHRLWTYVPDTHGAQDPVLPFVALYCHLGADADRDGRASA